MIRSLVHRTSSEMIAHTSEYGKGFPSSHPPTAPILGVNVSCIDIDSALDYIGQWIERNEQRYVCVADVHQIMQAYDSDQHKSTLSTSSIGLIESFL